MGTLLLLNQIKKRAESFIQEKYKTARMILTDVSEAELLAEEVTNNDPMCPDPQTMALIAEASSDVDDYWRIVDLIHNRLANFERKQWRKSYKSLVLLEFLITHGPVEFAEDFVEDVDIIEELGRFQYTDEKGFNWGDSMQKRSENILKLLNGGGDMLREARLKALGTTRGIQGFGSSTASPASPSSPSSSATLSAASSFGSFSTRSSTRNDPVSELSKQLSPTQGEIEDMKQTSNNRVLEEPFPVIEETDSLLDSEDDDEKPGGFISGIRSKLSSISPSKESLGEKMTYRSFSNTGSVMTKKHHRQFSMGY